MSKGLYRLELSKDMRRFERVNFYSSLPNSKGDAFHVMTIMGRVVFSYGAVSLLTMIYASRYCPIMVAAG